MAMESTHGRMADSMKASTEMTKNMVMVFTHGQTKRSMLVIGTMENNMDWVNFSQQTNVEK